MINTVQAAVLFVMIIFNIPVKRAKQGAHGNKVQEGVK